MNSTALTMCWSLDSILALHADELLEIAQVDAAGEVLLGPLDGVPQTVELVDRLQDVGLGGDHHLELARRQAAERVDPLDVERVGAGDAQLAVDHLERDHAVAARERARHAGLDQVGVQVQCVDAHVLEAGVGGDRPRHVDLVDGSAAVVGPREAHVLDQLVGDGALLVGARVSHPLRQHLPFAPQLRRLLARQHALALQDVGHQLGGQVHGGQ